MSTSAHQITRFGQGCFLCGTPRQCATAGKASMKLTLSILTLLLALVCACSSRDAAPQDDGDVVTASAQAISVGDYTGPLAWVIGTYNNCINHANGSLWSLSLTGGNGAYSGTQKLKVKKGDPNCQLQITQFVDSAATPVTYTDGPAITLATSYAGTASVFSAVGQDASTSRFYANAEATGAGFTGFTANFGISILYSASDSDLATAVQAQNYVSVTATISSTPAPVCTWTPGTFEVDDDSTGAVNGLLGSGTLTCTNAQNYVLNQGALPATWAGIDTAYKAGTPTAYAGATSLSPSAFPGLIIGATLPYTGVIIVQNVQSGVPSYQTLTFTVSP